MIPREHQIIKGGLIWDQLELIKGQNKPDGSLIMWGFVARAEESEVTDYIGTYYFIVKGSLYTWTDLSVNVESRSDLYRMRQKTLDFLLWYPHLWYNPWYNFYVTLRLYVTLRSRHQFLVLLCVGIKISSTYEIVVQNLRVSFGDHGATLSTLRRLYAVHTDY